MHTKIFTKRELKDAADLIRKGELVAFPTETVYGLGADAFNPYAIKKIFEVKDRPSDNPLIVHIASKKQLYKIADVPVHLKKIVDKLAAKFWPGPLTIVLKKKKSIADEVSGGLDTVAVRMPNNRIALALIKKAGVPIAAPSANISGKPSSTCFEHVFDDFDGKIAGIIKAKDCKIGIESTVVDIVSEPPLVLRPGGVTVEQLKKIIPNIKVARHKRVVKARSPGMKYRHYSPNAKVILFKGSAVKKMLKYKEQLEKNGKIVIVIKPEGSVRFSKRLFKLFRQCDKKHIDYILIQAIPERGIGLAIMNRIKKAAYKVIK
ncbi:MAG: L-threonylcarbamoyladenylate synthase [Candidatus Micrarchaeia archaeon]